MIHTFPTSLEIVAAVRDWLRDEIVPNADPARSFQARVAVNLLSTIEREMSAPDEDVDCALRATLDDHHAPDEAALALMLRRGEIRPDDELIRVLRLVTSARLRASNPRHLEGDIDDDPRATRRVETPSPR